MVKWYNTKTMEIEYFPEGAAPEGYTKEEPLPWIRFQKFDGTAWVKDDEAEAEHAKFVEIESIKKEIAQRDYRALKAFKLGMELDELYPGETQWYQDSIARIHELENREE